MLWQTSKANPILSETIDCKQSTLLHANEFSAGASTYYNGAAFQTNDSSLIWQFTEEQLPQILA
jgi:hypothetical protein